METTPASCPLTATPTLLYVGTHIHKVDLNKTLKEQKDRSYTLPERRLNTFILQNTC